MRFDEIKAGDAAELSKTITDADIVQFAGISGDFNPVHMDQQAAERSRFGGRIAHGMLTASLISGVLGMRLPGPGAIYLHQSLRFTGPVMLGDTVTARVEVLELIPAKQRVRVATTCRKQTGETVLDGEAVLWVPDPS